MKQRWIEVDDELDLVLTLRTARLVATDPAFRIDRDGVWRASWTPAGPVTTRLQQQGNRVRVEAWGAGSDSALESAPSLIGLDDQEAADFAPQDEPLRTLGRRFAGLRAPRTGAVLEALLPAIVTQKVAGKEAALSYRAFVRGLGEAAPGPRDDLRLPPRAEVVAALGYEEFHRFGIERGRAERMRRAAAAAGRLEQIPGLPREQGWSRLEALPGIGHWTAAKVLWPACGDADAVPLGDYNLPSLVSWNLAAEARADDRRMLHLLEPYRGQRARVLHWLELGGQPAPRFGPRQALRRIANA